MFWSQKIELDAHHLSDEWQPNEKMEDVNTINLFAYKFRPQILQIRSMKKLYSIEENHTNILTTVILPHYDQLKNAKPTKHQGSATNIEINSQSQNMDLSW